MPVLNSPSCTPSLACTVIPFPISTTTCFCDLSVGGVNDLYFLSCEETLSEVNLLDLAWWQNLVTTNSIGKIGIGLGTISKKSDKKERVGSCRTEQIVQTTWALKYTIKCFDKTSARITNDQVDQIIKRFNNFLLIARMCDGNENVLPIGVFTPSDFNWTVPDNAEEFQSIEIEMSWIELGLPKTYDVVGLSNVLPKAA